MFWLLRAIVSGRVDPRTGYLCDIRTIDRWLREQITPALCDRLAGAPPDMAGVAGAFLDVVNSGVGEPPPPLRAERLEIRLSPFMRYAVMTEEPKLVHVTRAYEFSAAHRLHCPDLSEEENRRVFGKCSNPHGHGHNYVLEVTLRGVPDRATGVVMDLQRLDGIVNETVVDRFDHRNLNVECDEFASLNPSVENIARVIFRSLRGALSPAELYGVRVWETPKTYADCTVDDLE